MTERVRAAHVVTVDGVVDDAEVVVDGDRIVAVEPAAESSAESSDGSGGWLVPGFVDLHVHGGGGFDYATTDAEQARAARDFHLRYGTTTSLASLVTASVDDLCAQLGTLSRLTDQGVFAGIHLEGPFLSPVQKGAHDAAWLIEPDPATVDRLIEAGRGSIRLITIAPELPGAVAAIERFVAAGVRVAVGHTDASAEDVRAAIAAGATVATHLFNAMRAVHHREPGPVPVLLTSDRVFPELIADGLHLDPEILRLALAAAGPERLMLVTDAMVAAGMPDGRYALGPFPVEVEDGLARLVDATGEPGSIAGSTLTMAGAFALMTSLTGDIPAVSAMASTNPARALGLAAGRIEPGARADLCLVDDVGVLRRVMAGGSWLS